jgi:uncharacterized protein (DUF433 family)
MPRVGFYEQPLSSMRFTEIDPVVRIFCGALATRGRTFCGKEWPNPRDSFAVEAGARSRLPAQSEKDDAILSREGKDYAREQGCHRKRPRDPEILGGTPVFRGTRVPFKNLLDYLEGGHTLDEFLDEFPTVTREAAIAALEHAKNLVIAQVQ